MAEKKYVGNSKAIKGKFGVFYNLSMKLDDLMKLPTNEKGYIRVTMSELKEPDKFGNTHTLYHDDYVPKAKVSDANEDIADDLNSLPF
jgi:hypothetical protein